MSMRTIRVDRRATVREIVARAYRIGDREPELLELAEGAIRAANPHLGEEIEAGSEILVPEITGVERSDATSTLASAAAAQITNAIDALTAIELSAKRSIDGELDEITASGKLVARGELRNVVAEQAPALVDRLDFIGKTVKERSERVRSAHEQLASAVGAAKRDLERLRESVG